MHGWPLLRRAAESQSRALFVESSKVCSSRLLREGLSSGLHARLQFGALESTDVLSSACCHAGQVSLPTAATCSVGMDRAASSFGSGVTPRSCALSKLMMLSA